MAKNNRRDRGLEDEARAYVSGLPDETAEGRMVTDSGAPADAWRADQDRPQARRKGAPLKGDPTIAPDKRGNPGR